MAQSFIPMLSRFGTVGPWYVNDFTWQGTNSFYQERILLEYISRFLLIDFRLDLFLWNLGPYFWWNEKNLNKAQRLQELVYYSTLYHVNAWIIGEATSFNDFHIIDDFWLFNCSIFKVSNFCIYTCNIYKVKIGAINFNIYLTGAFLKIINNWMLNFYNFGFYGDTTHTNNNVYIDNAWL